MVVDDNTVIPVVFPKHELAITTTEFPRHARSTFGVPEIVGGAQKNTDVVGQ
jgi:hypothetical protein